jgi:hypothetical protein
MRALYATRLEGLGPDDRVKIECAACKHVSRIAVTGLGLSAYTAVLDLKHRLRCRECGARGRCIVSIEWADPL